MSKSPYEISATCDFNMGHSSAGGQYTKTCMNDKALRLLNSRDKYWSFIHIENGK